jgi:hypothetical protein
MMYCPGTTTFQARFFTSGDYGITYGTVEEIVWFLFGAPELIQNYNDCMISLANVHGNWGDFRGMRETLNFLVDVRVSLARLRGEKYLS